MGVKKSLKYQQARAIIHEGINAGLTQAAIVGQSAAIAAMGSEGGGVVGKTRKGRNVYAPSPAGRFPGIRTGGLRRSVYATPSRNLRAAFGSNSRVGRWLEDGTARMAARPWLMRSAQRAKPRMSQVAADRARAVIAARMAGLGGGA